MIEGLHATITGAELAKLCLLRSEYHQKRYSEYEKQIFTLEGAKIEGMDYTGGDPIRSLKDRKQSHADEAVMLQFIGTHTDETEQYRLSPRDLVRLGIGEKEW